MYSRSPKWFVVLRDLLLLGVGIFGLLHQELTGQANPALLLVYTTILGIPGAANLIAILRSTGPTGDGEQQPSPPPVAAPSSESSS